MSESSYGKIYEAVHQIPRGNVATYGQVARLAGLPRHARQVGYALNALPEDTDVPWHRVINAKGEISLRGYGDGAEHQEMCLAEEGVVPDHRGRYDLTKYQWKS